MVASDFVFAVPGSLETPTGGYAYDRRILAELAEIGCRAEVIDLGTGFPRPTPQTRAEALALLGRVLPGKPIVIDGLALGVLPDAAAALRPTHPVIALVHHPLALESGLSIETAESLRASERSALAAVRHVIATSPTTARMLASDYDVSPDRVSVAPPGCDPAARSHGSKGTYVALLAVGSLVPRKGYDVLLAALSEMRDLPWRLTLVGDPTRSPETSARLRAQIAAANLAMRVTLAGAVPSERLAEFYRSADIFVLASRFEGYGMAFSQAIAHGLPVIGTTAGAIPETVPAGTGILVRPDDPGALAAALRRLITDPPERLGFAAAARAAAGGLPRWRESAQVFRRVLMAVG